MKKKLALILGGWVVWIFLMALPTLADGGPHRANSGTPSGSCASCHRTHTASAGQLLKQAQPQLCFSCHGDTAQGAGTNVEGGVYYSVHKDGTPRSGTITPLRSGGFAYALINTTLGDTKDSAGNVIKVKGATGQTNQFTDRTAIQGGRIAVLDGVTNLREPVTSAHNIDPSAVVTIWGAGDPGSGPGRSIGGTAPGAVGMSCGTCHDPHGDKMYRLLRVQPLQSDMAKAVSIADEAVPTGGTKNYGTTDYWNVGNSQAPELAQKISDWCTTCHTRYLADSGSARNASGDTIFAFQHMTKTQYAYAPICIQCHVSHGTNAVMTSSGAANQELPGGAAPPDTTKNSRLLRLDNRGICQMCHLR